MHDSASSPGLNTTVGTRDEGSSSHTPKQAGLFGSSAGPNGPRATRSRGGPARGRANDAHDLAVADRRRTDRRRQAERLVQRARWLRSDERAVVEAVYGEGRTCADLARLMDLPADAVRRRVRRATKRAASGLFVFVATRRESWPATRRRVATRCVLEGATLRQAAAELKLSLHAVRKHWDAVRALYEAEGAEK